MHSCTSGNAGCGPLKTTLDRISLEHEKRTSTCKAAVLGARIAWLMGLNLACETSPGVQEIDAQPRRKAKKCGLEFDGSRGSNRIRSLVLPGCWVCMQLDWFLSDPLCATRPYGAKYLRRPVLAVEKGNRRNIVTRTRATNVGPPRVRSKAASLISCRRSLPDNLAPRADG